MILLTRVGCVRAKFRAMRQPRVEAAMSVAGGTGACSKRAATSDVKEGMDRLLRGWVGERPWPSRSKRWHL